MQCDCGNHIHPEREAMGYSYCIKCAADRPELSRPEFGVLGVHKSSPIVVSVHSPEWLAHTSFMRR